MIGLRFKILIGLCMLCLKSFAYDFEFDGLCYNLLSSNTVEITYRSSNGASYAGELLLPDYVYYNNKRYQVTSIGEKAFLNCIDLKGSLTIPNSVTSIGNYAFSGCINLTGSLSIPNSVTSIGDYAFSQCCSFTGTLTISNSVTSIGHFAFYNCYYFSGSLTIPNSVTYIGKAAFKDCSGFTGSLTISSSISRIENNSFSGCFRFTGLMTIPNSVTSIGDEAFSGCFGFTSLTIPNSVTSIGSSAFNSCSGLTSVQISNIASWCKINFSNASSNPLTYAHHLYLNGEEIKDLLIPNYYEDYENFTSIGRYAFCGCSGLTSVTIPNNVTSIGEYTFAYCSGLTSVTIPNNVTSIGEYTFSYCSGLTSVTIPNNVAFISDSAFAGCNSLFSVQISNIASWCKINFYNASSNPLTYAHHLYLNDKEIKDLVIPNSVTSIGRYAFCNCNGLTSVTIPNSITSIGNSVFEGCSGLTAVHITDLKAWCEIEFNSNPLYYAYHLFLNGEEINNLVIPNSVTSIGSFAFHNCSGLTSVTIPNSVTSIGTRAFGECKRLEKVYSKIQSPFFLWNSAFSGIPSSAQLYVPKGTKSKYIENGWTSYFSEVIEEGDTTPNTYSLSITTSGNGSATFSGTSVRNKTQTFTIDEGASATVSFTPDSGNRIASVKVNSQDVTASVANYQYTISSIAADTKLEVTFEEIVNALVNDDVNYSVVSQDDKTVRVSAGKYGQVLTVPESFVKNGVTWTVTGIETDALKDNADLAAIVWNPNAAFTATVSNPNLLMYVKDAQYVPGAVKNVVVNGTANSITLVDAESGNNFFCPQQFIVRNISYIHHYGMATGIGESRGWETISLPFDVQTVTHATKGTIVPFATWTSGDAVYPFWLYELNGTGWAEAQGIKAYTPYIISMPNNSKYKSQFQLAGNVTFAASNVTVGKTEDFHTATYSGRTFTPTFSMRENGEGLYALNVNNDFISDNSGMTEGSRFVLNMRKVHPFEAYMTTASQARQFFEGFET